MNSVILTLVLIFLSVFNISLALSMEEIKETFVFCTQEHALDKDLLMYLKQHSLIPDENNMNQKCFFSCMAKRLKLIDDEFNMNVPLVKEYMARKHEQLSPENISAIIEKCKVRSETDLCDRVYGFHKCKTFAVEDFAKS